MLGTIVLFGIAAVVGYRRGILDGKAVIAITAISLFALIIALAGWAAFTPRAVAPGAAVALIAFLRYFLPLLAGFALGTTAKRQRLRNDAEDDGAA